MSRRRALRLAPTAGIAALGVMVAHWLAYVVAVPHAQVREAVLAATGHGYWGDAVRLVVALFGCGLAALVLSNLGNDEPERPALSGLVLRLSLIQCVAFLAMESLERLASHTPVATVLRSDVLVLGLAVQVLTAFLGALLLRWLHRAVAELVAVLRRPSGRPKALALRRSPATPFRARPAMGGASGLRGPPLS